MRVEVNNFHMAYDEQGSGVPLLFIHGFPYNRQMWKPQLEGLSRSARVLAPDLRGHGESDIVPEPNWMETLAEDLAAFLDALGITRPVVLCGLSMGGYVAMAFYRKHAPRMGGLILAATRAKADSPEARANRDQSIKLAQEKGPRAIAEAMLPKAMSPKTYDRKPELVEFVRGMMERLPVETITGDLTGMRERTDSTLTLAEIEIPVLILHGRDDQLIPLKEAEAMQKDLPDARLQVIPDAGHLLNLEQPEMFNQAVLEYLERLKIRG